MLDKSKPTESIAAYIAGLDEPFRSIIAHLRQVVLSAAPEAEEIITYAMPGIGQNGPLIAYSAFRNHCSLFPMGSPLTSMAEEIAPWKTSKGTLQFTQDNPIPDELVVRIVHERLAENAARAETRKAKRGKAK
ncbi:MAG: DUF1801 domain-containing protein [Hyphomicrobiaceae bacterium]|nr:DUF1801 domain-containing protein [Hyphomicrobiaceae bacterium]MCC0023662.1 DUF1801 domain-containing protein [Hyphomicrobiaceae bacterium]